MPLLPFKTAERRIGILGPSWSGKTILMTSLINHLKVQNPSHFHIGSKKSPSAHIRKFTPLPPGDGWLEFEYEKFRERLVHRRWPRKTHDHSVYTCQFERTDWKIYDVMLKLYDLPGERINDFAMLRKGSDTFASWSDNFFKRVDRDITYADRFESYLKKINEPTVDEEQILLTYKATLARLRQSYKPYRTPSTFDLDRQGETPARDRSPEQLALERVVGLGKGDEFAPLPATVRLRLPAVAEKFSLRFDRYCREMVEPLVETMRSCHSLIIMVDVLQILASDTGTRNDYQELIRDMLRALDPKESFLSKGFRKLGEAFLPHQLRPGWISRIAFVTPKSDLVHPDDRNRLKHLLRAMVERDARDLDGVTCDFFNVAAVQAARKVEGSEAKRLLMGSTMLDGDGRLIEPGDQLKYHVSPLPDDWPSHWKVGDYSFPSVYPQIPPLHDRAPDHIGLDDLFNFVCE